MSDKRVRFALIGCGRIVGKHIEVLKALPNTELIAVCDVDENRSKKIAAQHGLKSYKDYHTMMKSEKTLDVVSVLTESGLHGKIVTDLAPYEKHIIVEKPMALTLDDADKMISACDAHDIKLFVVKQNRYNKAVVKLKEAVEQGRFGKLVMGTVRVRWCRTQSYYDLDPWRGTWAMDGGVMTNQASHHIDLLEWMMGDVESVFAKTGTMLVDIETEDTGLAIVKFTNGALGLIEATTATRPKDLEGSISILGEKGSVEIGGFAVNEIKVWQFEDGQDKEEDVIESCRQKPDNVYGYGHYEYIRNVVDCLQHGQKALVDGLEGRKSLELINAIYESAETGKEVPLKFRPKRCRLGHS